MQTIITHRQLFNLVQIEFPLGGCLKDILVSTNKDDATAATECFSDSDSSAAKSTTPRGVHFELTANVQYEPRPHTCDEDVSTWYSKSEYKLFRRQTHAIAKKVAAIEQQNIALHSYERTVTRIHKACQVAATMEDDDGSINCLSVADRRHLNRWAQAAPVRHGLDKWSLTKLSKTRSLQRNELQAAIIEMQKRTIKDECYHEKLRATSERMSRPARLFSHYMAESLANSEVTAQFTA
ncbi:hypothetical protein MPSEU_000033400 [Mayamaea pseudoterrestris]|nr:hypothetical protein MPSEU_000033400 [Mayamaea pseudoterrestris]